MIQGDREPSKGSRMFLRDYRGYNFLFYIFWKKEINNGVNGRGEMSF